jgi:hypothetical protein
MFPPLFYSGPTGYTLHESCAKSRNGWIKAGQAETSPTRRGALSSGWPACSCMQQVHGAAAAGASMTPFLCRSHAAFRMLCFALFRAKIKEANRMYVTAARIEACRLDLPRQRELTNVTAAQIGATIARSIIRPSRNFSSLSGRLSNEPSVSRIATAVRPTNRQPAKQGRAFWDKFFIWRCPLSLHHRAAAKNPNELPRHVTFKRPPAEISPATCRIVPPGKGDSPSSLERSAPSQVYRRRSAGEFWASVFPP